MKYEVCVKPFFYARKKYICISVRSVNCWVGCSCYTPIYGCLAYNCLPMLKSVTPKIKEIVKKIFERHWRTNIEYSHPYATDKLKFF